MAFELADMAPHIEPTVDLPLVILVTAAHELTAVPLKPPARVIGMDPTFLAPMG